jgi:hypothetical protein
MVATIFKNIFSKEPHFITIDSALDRIKKGTSDKTVNEIRNAIDKEKANKIKLNLPSVCFSGKFGKDRRDDQLIQHSGFLVLDFDDVDDIRSVQVDIISEKFVYACWISPSGKGLKALIKIADGSKHREHFQALQEIFPIVDKSGINVSRVCYESYDPNIYINTNAEVFKKVKKTEKITTYEKTDDDFKIFKNILTWLSNKNEAFVTGERNNFIFKLASACCRFGINETAANQMIVGEFISNSEFAKSEADRAIKSGYRANSAKFGNASFEKERLVDKITRKEVEVEKAVFDDGIKLKDVVYGIDVKEQAMNIYDTGYSKVDGINVQELDERFKPKRGEITVLTGIGNYGKSSFKKWYQAMRILMYGEKFASFAPEDNPPEEYYHDFVEIILGCDCSPSNPNRPSRQTYEFVYDMVCEHIFYVYPKDSSPTPKYVMEVFLELIIKENIDGVDIDPFNQMTNDYKQFSRTDKYLEWVLSVFGRFAQINNVFFWIVAHPTKMMKASDGNYPCPDVYDLTDGAMWNNKMDNILVYHRPFAQTDPQNPTCEFHSKKIRRQKVVGKKGFVLFEMLFRSRRFYFNGLDPMQKLLNDKNINFKNDIKPLPKTSDQFIPFVFEDNGDAPF